LFVVRAENFHAGQVLFPASAEGMFLDVRKHEVRVNALFAAHFNLGLATVVIATKPGYYAMVDHDLPLVALISMVTNEAPIAAPQNTSLPTLVSPLSINT
jgi:hypothetical protein